jgi:SAM-dependent methyltransferase
MLTIAGAVERACPLCGSASASLTAYEARIDHAVLDSFAFASRKVPEYMHHRLFRCAACDLLYANPIPPADSLINAYEQAGFDSATEARHAARTYGRILDRFVDRLPDRDGALDIGAGDGAFLGELLRRGFTRVMGVEPSSAPVAAADSVVKPLIHRGAFRADLCEPSSLSVVTCFQTIEHLPDPLTVCLEAAAMLRPGGALLIVGHNRDALSARVLGRRSPIFDIEHLQLFSSRSARVLLERAGLVAIDVRPIINRYPLAYWARMAPLPARAKVAASRCLRKFPGALPLPAGNLALLGFRAVPRRAGRLGMLTASPQADAAAGGTLVDAIPASAH